MSLFADLFQITLTWGISVKSALSATRATHTVQAARFYLRLVKGLDGNLARQMVAEQQKTLDKRTVMSWIGRLRAADAELAARNSEPWLVRLVRVRGKAGSDGVERIATQALFDHLEVLQRNRGAGACRRLARVMRELGWTAVRVRDLSRGGYVENIRGYCRKP